MYRVRGWDGWHRHVALALLASAFRACLSPAELDAAESDALVDDLPAFPAPVALHPADDVSFEGPVVDSDEAEPELIPFLPVALPTIYHLVVDLLETDWRAVRAFQTWLVANEAGTILDSSPSRAEIERQEVSPRMEVHFESTHSLEQILAALDEVPEIVIAELTGESAACEDDAADLGDADDLLAALEAELSTRMSAREAGLMPAFEGPAEVIGNAVSEVSRALEQSHELVAAHAPNGHANGHATGNGVLAVASLGATVAPPAAPPAEAPARPAAPPSPSRLRTARLEWSRPLVQARRRQSRPPRSEAGGREGPSDRGADGGPGRRR